MTVIFQLFLRRNRDKWASRNVDRTLYLYTSTSFTGRKNSHKPILDALTDEGTLVRNRITLEYSDRGNTVYFQGITTPFILRLTNTQ